MAATDHLTRIFERVACRGSLHAVDIDHGREVGVGADRRVVIASIVKVLLALELFRQAAAGQLDPTERVVVSHGDRLGGWGTAGCTDDVELSLRDLAWFALTISDNTAADVLLRRIGTDVLQLLATELRMDATRIVGGPRELLASMVADVGASDSAEFARIFPTLTPTQVRGLRAFDPQHTTSSTPRDITHLLSAIWSDTAGPPEACAAVRAQMAQQLFRTRIASGFPPSTAVSAKTGTLPGLQMEAGVVEPVDGGRYAIAIFARSEGLAHRRTDVDLAIGEAARVAVDALRKI